MENRRVSKFLVKLSLFALFSAIIIVLAFTPAGYIMIPGVAITTVHIPVIIGSFVLGIWGGTFLGLVFGLTSFFRALTTPDLLATIVLVEGNAWYTLFLVAAILVVPRVLTGLFSGLAFRLGRKIDKTKVFALGISSFIGSITNTIFVLGGVYVFAFERAAAGFGLENPTYGAFAKMLLGIVALNGVPEAIFAVIVCTLVAKILLKYMDDMDNKLN